jgi:hypothetical protein
LLRLDRLLFTSYKGKLGRRLRKNSQLHWTGRAADAVPASSGVIADAPAFWRLHEGLAGKRARARNLPIYEKYEQ